MITYRATLDVPDETLTRVSGMIRAHRRRVDARPWQRAASARTQALLVLRWYTDSADLRTLARDAGISIATAYRYLHEGITVIADQAPDLHDVLDNLHARAVGYLCLDGTLIETAAVHARNDDDACDRWYSGKHHRHGGNIQILTDPHGYPVWSSPVEPGSTHDMACARNHVLAALYAYAAKGLPTLADKGYTGAGIGIHTPIKGTHLAVGNRTTNRLITGLRAPAERANALLKSSFKALRRITLCPQRIGDIVAAALVLLNLNGGRW